MRCFKCEKEMTAAIYFESGGDVSWEAPSGGVVFAGGHNFGSALYDSGMNGIYVEVVICDDCLIIAKGSDRMRERNQWEEKS